MAKKTKHWHHHLTWFFQAGFEGSMLGTLSILIIGATYKTLVAGWQTKSNWRSNTTGKIMWGSQKERKSTSGERKWEIKSNIWTKHSQLLVEENLEHAGCQKKKDLPNGCTACQQTSMYPEFWGLGGLPRVPAWPGFMKPCGPRVWGPPWGPPPCPCPIPRFNVPMWPYLQAMYWGLVFTDYPGWILWML